MPERGLLIAFEGGDGGGKSTQARLLAERIDGVHTRQAGGTPLGQRIRALVLDPESAPRSVRAEALLFMADRADHIDTVVEPALAEGRHVVTDRYAYSSVAYQGYAGGLDVQDLYQLADWAMIGLWPDAIVLIDVPAGVSAERRHQRNEAVDRFEGEDDEFHAKVIDGYEAMAGGDPEHWYRIDGTGSVEEVAERVWAVLEPLFADRG